jgi:hypothetical protein
MNAARIPTVSNNITILIIKDANEFFFTSLSNIQMRHKPHKPISNDNSLVIMIVMGIPTSPQGLSIVIFLGYFDS